MTKKLIYVSIERKKNWGSITAKTYIDHILQQVIAPFFLCHPQQIFFMDDNAPAHKAKITKDFKKNHLIRTTEEICKYDRFRR